MIERGALVAVGRTSDVYEFGVGAVVKVPRAGVPDHWAVREAEFTAAVGQLDVPAPSVVDLTRINGRWAIVFERIDGRSMWEHMLDDPTRIPALACELGDAHRRIFAAGPAPGLEGLIDRMVRKIAEVDTMTASEQTEAEELAVSLPHGAALLHGDMHPGNVLMTTDGPVVIDWFDASIGHPVADVVRSSILLRPSDANVGPPHLRGADRQMLELLHSSYVESMGELLGERTDVLRSWEALVAVSRLSEGLQSDESELMALWQARRGGSTSPLLAMVTRRRERAVSAAPD